MTQSPDMLELAACPFCGKRPLIIPIGETVQIACETMGCMVQPFTDDDTLEEVTRRWNTRTPSPNAGLREALFEPATAHARYNLEGALYDIERLSAEGKPTDQVCIRTIRRVIEQLAKAEAALSPAPAMRGEGG